MAGLRDMGKYTTLFWDMDMTLLDFKRCEYTAIKRSFERFGRTVGDDVVSLYSKINDSYWKRLELGQVTKKELLVGRFQTLLDTLLMHDLDAAKLQPVYQEELSRVAWLLDGAWVTVASCKGMGYRQYVVTNGVASTQRSHLRLTKLDKLVDGEFISEEMGAEKPSAEFFDRVFASLNGVERADVLLIGDSLTSDMRGGKNAGIDTCWFNPGKKERDPQIPVTYEIHSLTNLLAIVS